MQQHRSTQHKVSKEGESSNFDAGTALENLRAEVIDIEALARAAEAAAEALPAPTTDRQRVVFGRILSLATKASEQASASLRERADHRARSADGGPPEGCGLLSRVQPRSPSSAFHPAALDLTRHPERLHI